MKLSDRERLVLDSVDRHGQLSERALGDMCTSPRDRWDAGRRLNLGRAVARSMQAKGLLAPSAVPGYWKVAG